MKRYLFFILLFLTPMYSVASWNGIENLTSEQKKSKLSACKKLKAENKLLELTAKDFSVCNELLSDDLMSSYENNPKSITEHQTEKKEKITFTEEEMDKLAVCEAEQVVKTKYYEHFIPTCNKIRKTGAVADTKKVEEYINKINEWKNKQEETYWENRKKEERKEFFYTIAGISLFLFFCWLFFFIILPKLIYVIRKAWLKAAEDAKQ